MSSNDTIAAIVLSVIVVFALVGPALAVAQEDDLDLTVDTEGNDEVLVTVTANGTAVANVTVNVTVDDENVSYDGVDEYETDENGTVSISVPDQTVAVTITATDGNRSTETSIVLEPAEIGFSVSVGQAPDGTATVTVLDNASAVEGATVNVSVNDENVSYDGADEYTTDENGTVILPAPSETMNVSILVSTANQTASTTGQLDPPEGLSVSVDQADDGTATVFVTDNASAVQNATVNVTVDDENVSYDGAGEYTTDDNGTVDLSAPDETVNLTVTAEYENRTASTSALLVAPEDEEEEDTGEAEPFGQMVSSFVHDLLGNESRQGGIGDEVSAFVTANNPGVGSNGTGPPEHANNQNSSATNEDNEPPGQSDRDDSSANSSNTNDSNAMGSNGNDSNGNGGNFGPGKSGNSGNGNGQGPPDHAGGPNNFED